MRLVRVSIETMRKDARQKALDDPLLDKVFGGVWIERLRPTESWRDDELKLG